MNIQEIRDKKQIAYELHTKNESNAAKYKFVKFACGIVGGIAMFTGLGLFFITGNALQILLGCSGVLPIAGARIFRYFKKNRYLAYWLLRLSGNNVRNG